MDNSDIKNQNHKLSGEARQRILELKREYPNSRSALLPALHVVQQECGFVPDGPMAEVAELLEILPGDVEQVMSFYRMYNHAPVGHFHVKVCDSISCYLRGSDELIAQGKQKLGIELNETTADGQITLSKTECLGSCGSAPCLQVNDEFLYNVSPAQFNEVLDSLKTAKENPYYIP